MAKTIKITIYNPKELWIKFCNWVFWPRHKKCADWCNYYDGVLDSMIVEILQDENAKGTISDETAERLEISLKHANYQVSKQTAELMSERRLMKRISIKIDCDLDLLFWHLVPSININLHSHEIEFEWLCIGIYISKIKQNNHEEENQDLQHYALESVSCNTSVKR